MPESATEWMPSASIEAEPGACNQCHGEKADGKTLALRDAVADPQPIDADGGILPEAYRTAFRFRINPAQRRDLVERLKSAAPGAACASLEELAQINAELLRREEPLANA